MHRFIRAVWASVLLAGSLAGLAVATVGTSSAGASDPTTSSVVVSWGSFFGGDATGTLPSPSTVALPGPVVQVGASNSDEYALLANGTVWAWGLGGAGELGDGGTADSLTTPVQVQFPPGVVIASLPTDAMPYDTALAVDANGNAWGWGANPQGSLCVGTTQAELTPVELPLPDVTAIAGAGDHTLVDSEGTVYACGGNGYGDLGDGSMQPSSQPVPVVGLGTGEVKALVAAYRNSGALLSDGVYLDWGYDDDGQLGVGTLGQASDVPVAVPLPSPVTQVDQGGSITGNGHTLVQLANGALEGWGADQYGQIGNGTASGAEDSPVTVHPPAGVTFTSLATGAVDSYALSSTGGVYSWGAGTAAAGRGVTGAGPKLTPTLVFSGGSSVVSTANNVEVLASQPEVTSVAPSSGPATGGTTVEILGAGFANSGLELQGVSFTTSGGKTVAGLEPSVLSDNEIQVTSPSLKTLLGQGSQLQTSVAAQFTTGSSGPVVSSAPLAAGDNHYLAVAVPPSSVVVTGPSTLPAGRAYSATASAPGADPPATYALSGAPAWLAINGSTGALSGTPPAATSSFSFQVVASNIAGSATSALQQVTVVTPTSLSLSPSPPPSVLVGQSVTYTAQVTAPSGTPAGTVAFTDNGSAVSGCGAVSLVSGAASCTQSFSAPGTFTVAAVFNPSVPSFASSSAQVVQSVASNSTNWPGYLFSASHSSDATTATAINTTDASSLAQAWSFSPAGAQGFVSTPAVVNGTVYAAAGNGDFYALSQSTGQVLWSDVMGKVLRTTCGTRGFASSPTVAPDPVTGVETVYVASATGYLYALNAATGAVVWQSVIDIPSTTQNDYFDWSSPTVANGTVYVGVSSQCDNPLVAGSGLKAYNQETGALTAQFDTQAAGVIGGSIWSSAAVAPNGNVFVTVGNGDPANQLSGYGDSVVELNGTSLAVLGFWQIPAHQAAGTDSDFGASPTLFTATVKGVATPMVGACNKNGFYYALAQNDLSAGPVWEVKVGHAATSLNNDECISAASWNGQDLFMTSDPTTIGGVTYNGSIRELNPNNGAIVWATGLPGNVDGSASLDGSGVLSVATFDYSGAPNADYLVSATSGAILATVSTGDGTEFAQPVFSGTDLLLATYSGALYDYRLPGVP